MVRPSLWLTAKVVEGLALSLWLGGLVAVGALVAPAAFGVLERADAGRLAGEIFRRINSVGIACGGALLVALLLESVALPAAGTRWRIAQAGLAIAALGIGLYLGGWLFPAMEALRAGGPSVAFDHLHDLSGQLVRLQVFLLVGVLLTSAVSLLPALTRTAREDRQASLSESGAQSTEPATVKGRA